MPGDFCSTAVASFEDELGVIIEEVEAEVRSSYQLLLSSSDAAEASKYRSVLLLYSEARSDLDSVHISLASQADLAHERRAVVSGLTGITNRLARCQMNIN